ncbi:MAG: hypothetical protein HOL17_02810, partial [Gammaproteobacteria bacterium]|nr:hypothetical protein [Gammaproteobacteria bacterium]
NNSVEQFRSEIGAVADEIMVAIEQSVNRFFVQALQLDAFTMELEALLEGVECMILNSET